MKKDEAESVWGMISACYDLHPERSGEQATVWVPALEGMDAEIVMDQIGSWMRGKGPATLPKLPAFASEVQEVVRRRSEAARAAKRAELGLETGRPKPAWFVAWEALWLKEDYRVFPEMEQAYREDGEEWPPLRNGEPMAIVTGEEYERLLVEAALVEQTVVPHPKSPEPECELCEDDGVLVAGHNVTHIVKDGEVTHARGADQVVPCPKCDLGRSLEFPLETAGPWGRDGFYRNRPYKIVGRGRVEIMEVESVRDTR